jgi:hypothetical protein
MKNQQSSYSTLELRVAGILDPLDCISMYENAILRGRDDVARLCLDRASILLDGKLLRRSLVPTRLHPMLLAAGLIQASRSGRSSTWRKINRGGCLRRSEVNSRSRIEERGPGLAVVDTSLREVAANDATIVRRAA